MQSLHRDFCSVGRAALPTPTRQEDCPGETEGPCIDDRGRFTGRLPRPDGLAMTRCFFAVPFDFAGQLSQGGRRGQCHPPYSIDEKSGRTEISVRPLYSGHPPVAGKKQEGVKEGREGRRKNLDRGNLPNLAHPVESRGRQGQAESVGIKFVSAANQQEEDFRRAENIFCFGLALFV